MSNMKVIEVNGVKLEVNLSTARVIENYKIGDAVKVLKKQYSDYKVYAGVIIGFENFNTHPTIVIAYLDAGYNEAKVDFIYYNDTTTDVEITQSLTKDIPFVKSTVIEQMDRMILKKEQEVEELKQKKEYFLNNFGVYFEMK